jgi:hypothetical protein
MYARTSMPVFTISRAGGGTGAAGPLEVILTIKATGIGISYERATGPVAKRAWRPSDSRGDCRRYRQRCANYFTRTRTVTAGTAQTAQPAPTLRVSVPGT